MSGGKHSGQPPDKKKCQECGDRALYWCKRCTTHRCNRLGRQGSGFLCEACERCHVGQGSNGNWHGPKKLHTKHTKPYERDTTAACKFDGSCWKWKCPYAHEKQAKPLPKPPSPAAGGSMSAAAGGRKHVVSQSADPFGLRRRFVEEQRKVFAKALAEINAGQKESCWMWYVCPTPPYAPDGVESLGHWVLGSLGNRVIGS